MASMKRRKSNCTPLTGIIAVEQCGLRESTVLLTTWKNVLERAVTVALYRLNPH
jgi:hypothetical protein